MVQVRKNAPLPLLWVALASLFLIWPMPRAAASQPIHLAVPNQGICPDVASGQQEVIYEVYARNGNAFFASSRDSGRTFSHPVKLNRVDGTVLAGHERGPKIARSGDGSIHVIWMDQQSAALEYTHRPPRGNSFTEPVNLRLPGAHLDGAAIAAGPGRQVFIAWLDSRLPPDPRNPLSLPVFIRWSQDDGTSFSPAQPLNAGGARNLLRACSCCSLHAAASGSGRFDVAFRGAYSNIRDPWLAVVHMAGKMARTQVLRVADQQWKFLGCPMAGPGIAIGPKPGEVWVAWYSNGRIFYAHSADAGSGFSAPVSPAPHGTAIQNHPLIVVNHKGEALLAWEEGREVYWQTIKGGKVEISGHAGTLPPQSKAAAFVDARGKFFLVF
jgi:hypothetical protein